jgi:hypothetical protein
MKRMIVVLAVATLSMGCQTLTGKPARQHITDKWLTNETKATIVAASPRALTAVDVDVNYGVVYLTGNIPTAGQKARIERAASRVDGVRDVISHVRVQSESAAASPSASPRTGVVEHRMTGQVTAVDRTTGRLTLRGAPGDVMLQVPPAAIQDVKEGDRVSVRLDVSPAP